jgi:hypothetical protein
MPLLEPSRPARTCGAVSRGAGFPGKSRFNSHNSPEQDRQTRHEDQPAEKSWKNPSATFAPQNRYRNPVEAMRRLFVKIVTGIAERIRTIPFQMPVRNWYASSARHRDQREE